MGRGGGAGDLPAGPSAPVALKTLGWVARPVPYLQRLRARFGDVFTLRIANEPPWVIVADPAAIREVFTGDPALLHAGEGNAILGPILADHSVLLLDGASHLEQRRLLLPPFHGERMQRYGALMRSIAQAEVTRWPRRRPFARRAHAGAHARGHHPRGVRRPRARAGRSAARAAAHGARPRRPRDHRDRARLGARAPRPPPGRVDAPARGGGRR